MSMDNDNNGFPVWTETGIDWLDELLKDVDPSWAEPPAPEKTVKRPAQEEESVPRRTQEEPVMRRAAAQQAQPRRSVPRRSFADEEPVTRRTHAPEDGAHKARQSSRSRAPAAEPPYRGAKRRGRRGGPNKLLIALIALLGLGFVFAAWQLGSIFLNYRRDRSAYEELANNAIVALAERDEQGQTAEQLVTTEAGERVASEVPLAVDWTYLRSINSNIVGWLYSPDTVINYPVVQVNDHDFYLDHGFDGNPNTSGTLFADRNAAIGVVQSNYIVYGHNMKDESMLGTLKHYVDKSYFDQHPVMYYLTPNGSYRVELICAHIVEGTYDNFPGYFSTISDYQTYLNQITGESFWVNYDAITTEYQLMTLSTCTSAAGYEDARLLVHGLMVPIQ